MPARATLVAVVALVALLGGCADFVGCFGTATWREPGIGEWLAANADSEDFQPDPASEPLEAGPELAAAAPPGVVVTAIERRVEGGLVTIMITPGNLSVALDGPGTPPPAADVRAMVNATLDAAYRGDDRERIVASFAARWDRALNRSEGAYSGAYANERAQGPWDFSSVFPDGAQFAHESPGYLVATAGEWTFHARVPSWGQVGTMIIADQLDLVQYHYNGPASDVQAKVRRFAPSYNWTFQDYEGAPDDWASCR